MASLVADYSSESESSDSESSEGNTKKAETVALPKPDFNISSAEGHSVFTNPFLEEDNAKVAILERHVKMISTDVKVVNGKKICWNYRKKRCPFGHKCKYAHDSDLQIDPVKDNDSNKQQQAKVSIMGQRNDSGREQNCLKRPMCNDITSTKNKVMKNSKKFL